MAFLFDDRGVGTHFPTVIEQLRARVVRRTALMVGVGRHRARYAWRWIYWSLVHRSTQHASWLAEYEEGRW